MRMEPDPLLQRLERHGLIACGAMAAIALVLGRGNPGGAFGVLAGGALTAISYGSIKGAINAVMEGAGGAQRSRRRRWWALARGLARYGILALAAYVMIVRLRLHPAGVVAGASSLVIAAAWEAIGGTRPTVRPGAPEGADRSGRISNSSEFHGKA